MEQKGHEAFTVSPSSAKEASSDDVDGVKEQKEGMEETTYNGVEQRHEISTVPPLATEAASDDMTEEKEEREAVTTEMEETKGLALQRTVTLLGAVSFTIGSMIGSGIFITPTSVLRNTGSVAMNLIVWTLGGVLSLFGSLTVAELSCRVPQNGAIYAYLREGIGPWVGFIYTWFFILITAPSSLAVKSLTFSRYFISMVKLCGIPEMSVQVTAVTLIVSLCVLNMASNRLSVKVNVVFLFAKLLALVIIIIGGIVALATGNRGDSELSLGFEGTTESPADMARSFYFVMWAYGGWANANYIAEEVKRPSRNVPLAAILGVFIVTVVYILTNVSYLAVMSREQMLAADTVAVTWGDVALGTGAASLIVPLCVMASTAGSANSGTFVGPRVIFAAARDGNFPEVLSYIHVNNRTPIPAISVIIAIAMLYASASTILQMITVVGLTDWFFFFLCAISLLIIRYRQPRDLNIPFKQPLPVIVLFALFSLYLVVMPMTEGVDFSLLYTFAFLVFSVVVFVVFKCTKDRCRCCDGVVKSIQLLLQVGPPVSFNHSS